MSEQTNISPKKKPVATDELSEEALDQVAGGPASHPVSTVKAMAQPLPGAITLTEAMAEDAALLEPLIQVPKAS